MFSMKLWNWVRERIISGKYRLYILIGLLAIVGVILIGQAFYGFQDELLEERDKQLFSHGLVD